MINHQHFATTTTGLRRDTVPMRLFEKAKRLGIWNPSDIDFAQDRQDWQRLSALEQDVLLRLTVLFQAGEEAVTRDLLPLIMVIAQEGRLEEELFLTTFLFEEAKHTDFFRRFLDEVANVQGDLSHYHGASYHTLFYEALPAAMLALRADQSPAAQLRSAVTYNFIVEGVLAETGYHAYVTCLERNGLMPGQCHGVRLLKQDESRHIAYGLYLIARLLTAEPALWSVAEATMNALLPLALGVIDEIFGAYETLPFGLTQEEFVGYAIDQFQKRLAWLERVRGGPLVELMEIES